MEEWKRSIIARTFQRTRFPADGDFGGMRPATEAVYAQCAQRAVRFMERAGDYFAHRQALVGDEAGAFDEAVVAWMVHARESDPLSQ